MSVTFMRRAGLCCLLAALGNATLSVSAATGDHAVLNLQDAIGRTLARNPGLVSLGHQLDIQQGRLIQARLRPNPELGILVENILGAGDFQGADVAETTLSLGWILERGKRQSRVAVAEAGKALAESEGEIGRLDAAAETARLFLASLANQERRIQAQAALALAEQAVTAVGRRVHAGRSPEADLARAEAQFARAQLDKEEIEHRLMTSNHRLAAQWGESQPDFTMVTGNVHQLPALGSFSTLLARIDENPNLSRFLTEERLREAQLHLAEAEAKPDWRVSGGIRRLERSGDHAFVAGITIPLTMGNRNQGRIAEARARLSMTGADQQAMRIRIESLLLSLYQEFQHSLHRSAIVRKEVLPRFEKALADTRNAYAMGRYGYFELQLVQTQVLEARYALLEAAIDAHELLIEIERLVGTRVSAPAPKS